MSDKYLDNCLSIEGSDDAYKEKTKIAEVAATTMCRLNSIMKQMKDWRDDRVKLRSNIWRLKLALRVAGRETNDILHADPLIEHQRAEIKRLEADNQTLKKEISDIKAALIDADYVTDEIAYRSDDKLVEVKQEYLTEKERLNNEILYLKSRLKEVEEGHEHSSELEHLKCKLKHFMMVDHTMEIIFTDIVNKVAETIANLSEELVNVSERLHRSRMRNDDLCVEVDKLKAMLRFRNGDIPDYRKRIVELDNLTRLLRTELGRFKANLEDESRDTDLDRNNLKNAEQLANDLKNKLRNDYEALVGVGDPDCLKYIQKIFELRVDLKQLHVELTKTNDDRSRPENLLERTKYMKQFLVIGSTLKEINVEIGQLKDDHAMRYCKIGGIEGSEYLKKIEELRGMVERARKMMNELNRRTEGYLYEKKDIEELNSFVGKMCQQIKQLEAIVASNDRSTLLERIEQLEESIVRLKIEAKEKGERVNVLGQELFNAETLLEQRIEELNDAERTIDTLTNENRILKSKAKKMEEKTMELQREREDSEKELEQLQHVKQEANVTKKKLQNLQIDKEGLLKETGKLQDTLQKRNEEIKMIVTEKDSTERTLNAKIMGLSRNLQSVSRENEKLQSKINELERVKHKPQESPSRGKEKRLQEISETMNAELQQLRSNLNTSKESLDIANLEIVDLKARLEHLSSDKVKLESSVSQLESKKETLVYELGVEKTIGEERLKELTKLRSDYKELDAERINLRSERELLNAELTNLKTEKEQAERWVENSRAECSRLEDEIVKYRSECGALREEIGRFKTSKENLANKLEERMTELKSAEDKAKLFELENSRLLDDLGKATIKNAALDNRVQVLLIEKNELATRINELDGQNVALTDQLNKVRTENEYSAVELNKLRNECEKTRTRNACLRNTLDEAKRSNETLRRTGERLNVKMNEIYSERRILNNQLKILETANAALKKENETLRYEYVNNLRARISKTEKERSTISDEIFGERNEYTVECLMEKAVSGSKRDKMKSEKTKTKAEGKEELKKLMVENEALKFELLNLRSQNFEIKMELARSRDEFQRQKAELARNKRNETEISNKLEIVNLYYKEINSYSDHRGNMGALARIDQSNLCPFNDSTIELNNEIEAEGLLQIVNKLKIENVALKMEVNTLRCNFIVNFTEEEKRKNDIRNGQEEIQALREELTQLRDEKESLQVRLDTIKMRFDQSESEKAALKNELYTLRKTNSDLKHRANELQHDYQKLKETNEGFESCVMGTIKKIKKYTMNTRNLEGLDDELKVLLENYISNEKLLQTMSKQRENVGKA